MRDFIDIFNRAACLYLGASAHVTEVGANKLFDLIKANKFLEAISPNIALELQKLDMKDFEKLCEKTQTIEAVYKSMVLDQISFGKVSFREVF